MARKTNPAKATPPAPVGGVFVPSGFVPNKPKSPAMPPNQAPYRPGQSPAQKRVVAVRSQTTQPVYAPRDNTGDMVRVVNERQRVRALQQKLVKLGYHVEVDGIMGPRTQTALQLSNNGTQRNVIHSPKHATKQARRQVEREKTLPILHENYESSQNPLGTPGVTFVKPPPIEPARLEQGEKITHRMQYTPIYPGQKPTGMTGAFKANGKIYLPGQKPPPGAYITEVPYYKEDRPTQGEALQSVLGSTAEPGQQEALARYKAQNEPSPLLTGTLHPATDLIRMATGQAKPSISGALSDVGWIATSGVPVVRPARAAAALVADIKTAATAEGATTRAVAALRDLRAGRAADHAEQAALGREIAAQKAVAKVPIYSPERHALRQALKDAPNVSKGEAKATLRLYDSAARAVAKQADVTPEEAYSHLLYSSQFHDVSPTATEAEALAQGAHFQRGTLTGFAPEDLWDKPQRIKEAMRYASPVPFVSKLHLLVADMPEKVGVQELMGKIKSAGIKAEEIKWNKFDTFLAEATSKGQKSISKPEALAWLDKNYLKIEENRRFGAETDRGYGRTSPFADEPIFGQYTIEGGKRANYQEFAITLPEGEYGKLYEYTSHFPEPNILAHMRTTDRMMGEGERTLMIEEIQSDWHQAGQKSGYKQPVTEHPDYPMRRQAIEEAVKDVDAISANLRRGIANALLGKGGVEIPTNLEAAFERSAEMQLGINLTDKESLSLFEGRALNAEKARADEGRAIIVPNEPGHVSYNVKVPYSDGSEYNVGFFRQQPWDDTGYAWKAASDQTVQFNRLVDMPEGDFRGVRNTAIALRRALRNLEEKRSLMSALEQDVSRGVSDAPFVKTWHELAFKRMLAEAVDKGYDRVAWTTGRVQAERYQLANFFDRIEIQEGSQYSGSYSDALEEWAESRANSAVENMDDDELGLDSWAEERLQRDADGNTPPVSEEDYYVEDSETGDEVFDQEAYDNAIEQRMDDVDKEYESLLDSWRDDARDRQLEYERDYFIENSSEYDDAPKENNLVVNARQPDGTWHDYGASTDSDADNSLENVVGPDLARAYREEGQALFEGKDLAVGESAKSALGAQHFYDNKLTGFVNKYLKKTGVQSTKDPLTGPLAGDHYVIQRASPSDPRYVVRDERTGEEITARFLTSDEANDAYGKLANASLGAGTVVHSIPITDEVRAFVDQGLALFQRDPLVKSIREAQGHVKGAVVLGGKEGSSLHLFREANVTTPVHELGHIIQQYVPDAGLAPEEFARSFEQYVIEGHAPTKEQVGEFRKLASAMKKVYDNAPGNVLDDTTRRTFDRFFQSAAVIDPEWAWKAGASMYAQASWADEGAPFERGGPRNLGDLERLGMKPEDIPNPKAMTPPAGGSYKPALRPEEFDPLESPPGTEFPLGGAEPGRYPIYMQEEPPVPEEALTPAEQVREGLKGARSQYGLQKAQRSEEAKRRAQEVERALRTISDPDEAMAAAGAAMRGEMPKIDFQGLTTLDAQSLRALKTYVNQHEVLLGFQKYRLNKALDAAVNEGRVPTPSEMRLAEHVFGKKTAMGFAQVAGHENWDTFINIMNIPRTLMATADLSAIGRQSLVAGAAHPIIWGRNFPTAIKAFRSPQFYEHAAEEIKSDPLYNLALAARVSFTEIGEGSALTAHEEAFASDYAAKIPGVGHVVKGSARSYVGFLNKMRMDLFKQQIRIALKAGRDVNDEKFLKSIGDVINASTGRGTIHGRAEHILPALNTMLFSPRLMLSRLNYLDPTWYVRLGHGLPPGAARQVRLEALRGLFATAGAVSSIVYLASKIPGVVMGSTDPRSADFGKIKIGNTRVDVAGGFLQYTRLAAELATGAKVSSTTGQKTKLGSGYGVPTRWDEIQNFVYNKFAPVPAMAHNIVKGKDAVGNPVTPQGIALQYFTPLILQDAHDLYKEHGGGGNGIAWAAAGYGIGAFGFGEQTYAAKNPADKPTEKLEQRAKDAGMSPPNKEILLDLNHKANLDSLSQQHKNDPQGRLDAYLKYYAEITGDHQYDKWIDAKMTDDAAERGGDFVRHALIGPGLRGYEAALKRAEKVKEK